MKFIIPGKYWTNTGRTRAYKQLKGRSKNFNEELRRWCNDHGGSIVWSKEYNEIKTKIGVVGINEHSVISCKISHDTWVVYFSREEDAMLFKLTWL